MDPEDKNPPSIDPAHGSQVAPASPPQLAMNHGMQNPYVQDPLAGGTSADPLEPPVPPDLDVPWGWVEIALLIVIVIVGSLAVGVVLLSGAHALGIDVAKLRSSMSEQSLFLIVNQAVISLLLLVYLSAQMHFRFDAPFWRTIGWKALDTGPTPRPLAYLGFVAGGFLFAVLVQFASVLVGTKAKLPIEVFFQDRRSAFLLMLMGVLVAPVVEETVFRGYLYPVIARSFGIKTGIVATGILFGLLHAPQLKGGWGQIALLMVVGIVFTYARAAKGSVVASYLLHVSYNSCLFLEFIVASHGFQNLSGQ
jgi:membrane protease YdiL (CAAX protease family)